MSHHTMCMHCILLLCGKLIFGIRESRVKTLNKVDQVIVDGVFTCSFFYVNQVLTNSVKFVLAHCCFRKGTLFCTF